MTETKKKSAGRRILTAALIVLCVVLLFLLGVRGYFRLSVRSYYRHAEKTFVIPGLSDGMIVQGLAYEEEKGDFFVTGYRADGAASQVSLVQRADGKEQKRLSLADQSGNAYLGHVGGITVANDLVYVADEAGLMVYSLSDFYAAADGGTVTAVGFFPTKTADDSLAVAFVHNDGENIYVGEFSESRTIPRRTATSIRRRRATVIPRCFCPSVSTRMPPAASRPRSKRHIPSRDWCRACASTTRATSAFPPRMR